MWDPAAYLSFDHERARPFVDLLARVGAECPRRVVDLGCGPGHLTGLLSRRWPDAVVEALDSSPEMVAEARSRDVAAQLCDVRDWQPGPESDVVVCNAVLHWVPGHAALLERWVRAFSEGGWLAIQVPGNIDAPSHILVRELAGEPRWRGRIELRGEPVGDAADYAELLTAAGAEVDAWETTYLHRMTGPDPVLRWISGTVLRPVRVALADEEWDVFQAQLAPRLRAAYPSTGGVTWFPFRRVFAVAHKP